MCIPHIDIIPTPAPRRRHQKGPLPRIPLSIESIKPPETNYVSFSPKIIYRAPSSPRRSSLPPTHRPKCERSPEVEFLGGFIAGREALAREQEREKGRAPPVAAPIPIPVPAPPPPPPPPPPVQPPPPPPPPPAPPIPRHHHHHHHHRSHSHSPSSSSSSSSSSHSRYSLRALRGRVHILWDRVNGLEQWRDREAQRRARNWAAQPRERSWEQRRRRAGWGLGEVGTRGRGRGRW